MRRQSSSKVVAFCFFKVPHQETWSVFKRVMIFSTRTKDNHSFAKKEEMNYVWSNFGRHCRQRFRV